MNNSNLRLSMFQGVAKFSCEEIRKINGILQHSIAKKYVSTKSTYVKSFTFSECNLHPPGKLNYVLKPEEYASEIGSVSVKMKVNDKTMISFLVFKNTLKISGGVCEELIESLKKTVFFDKSFDKYVYELCDIFTQFINVIDVSDLNITCLNANMRMCKIDNFMTFCKEKLENNIDFYRVIMPLTNTRGRFGAVKVYPLEGVRSSAQFDGSGRVQFFGFKSVECLYVFSQMINKLKLN